MNWTGGRLQRHSGKSIRGGALTSRQKEHFAKVKANLRSGGQRNIPAKWSIFDKTTANQSQRQPLGSYANPGRKQEHLCTSTGERKESEVQREYWEERERHDQPSEPVSHRTESQKHAKTCSTPIELGRTSPIYDEDLYNATPPPLRIKRERAASPELQDVPQIHESREPKGESFEQKRRKLLNKADWVGLSIRRLPKLKFNPPKHDEDIGRRRKVIDGHRARYSTYQTRISSPFAPRKVQTLEMEGGHMRAGRAKSGVRISIGGRVVPPGFSSSSRPSKLVRQSTPRMMHTISSSDEMLLDDEYITVDRDFLNSDRFVSAFGANPHCSGGLQDDRMSISPSIDKNARGTYEDQRRLNDSGRQPLKATSTNEILLQSSSNASSLSHRSETSVCRMQQPKPMRPAKHGVLHLSSPKCTSSVLAQVGGVRSVVPEDQAMDNEIWKTWIERPTQSIDYDNHVDQDKRNSRGRKISISPGISATSPIYEETFGGSRLYDEDPDEFHEYPDSWEGFESSLKQESTNSSQKNVPQAQYNNLDPHSEMLHRSNFHDQSPSDYCENVDDTGLSATSGQYRNDDNSSIEQQYIRSSQRTSPSIAWDPPRLPSPMTESCQRRSAPLQQGTPASKLDIEPNKFSLQHNEVMLSQICRNSYFEKDVSSKDIQKKTDQDEIWMKFVFDEDSTDDCMLCKNTISARTEPLIKQSKPSRVDSYVTTSQLQVLQEKEKEEPSLTFSMHVHNSNDPESPLQPRYSAPTRNCRLWPNSWLGDNGRPADESDQSSGFSTHVYQSNGNSTPLRPPTQANGTPYTQKIYQVNKDSGVKDGGPALCPSNSNTPTPSASSCPESISMVAVPGS